MSREVWLRPNRRIFAVAIAGLALCAAVGIILVLAAWHVAFVALGCAVIAVAVLGIASMVQYASQPRLAYDNGHLLVFLGAPQPWRVPIEVVECFFLGQGPSLLPVSMFSRQSESPESSTVVVRLAESAEQWKHIEVRPDHGLWCDGYITIRGTLCEPINADRLKQLNHRLVETHREQRKQRERETA
jgi:hypothetical protein